MTLVAKFVDPDIFTVAGVFSAAECCELIDRAESIGFDAASVRTHSGPKMMTNIRNNDRVNLDDPELASVMWSRISHVLPSIDDQHAVGVDSRLRFYRYEPGQEFKRHKDGSVTNDDGHLSKLSYLVYLNGDFDGGSTTFRDYDGKGESRRKIEHVITPIAGSALLFHHQRWHEGSALVSGRKYVLRSDVFYSA
ncbi:putative 2-oxoglutarate/Fe(II)-dependent dioxygenase YbiX [Rhodopirellula rubra]|uniref:Putative 2-oxoglutarate/Fe(II)-dependent dioxygenase YbiX n=1 Tax=Aporhodopirellula rubra TaxID=980271 RepID=A0A7W5H9Z6_9BACT|nr:2OG-Fe(II) oxygenase [Aporhodopirellula rubra]MBB3210636.1 putative 2-oxoglutarate/Fe(II)-dependent dioxygenase YbiX [Aporhodopirellula rubra]